MQLKSVVLPAPFGPIRPQMAPAATSKETSCSAVTPPNRIVNPLTASKGQERRSALSLTPAALASASSIDVSLPASPGRSTPAADCSLDVSGKLVTCFVIRPLVATSGEEVTLGGREKRAPRP